MGTCLNLSQAATDIDSLRPASKVSSWSSAVDWCVECQAISHTSPTFTSSLTRPFLYRRPQIKVIYSRFWREGQIISKRRSCPYMKAIAPISRELQAKASRTWTKRAQNGVFQVLGACNFSPVMTYSFRSSLYRELSDDTSYGRFAQVRKLALVFEVDLSSSAPGSVNCMHA